MKRASGCVRAVAVRSAHTTGKTLPSWNTFRQLDLARTLLQPRTLGPSQDLRRGETLPGVPLHPSASARFFERRDDKIVPMARPTFGVPRSMTGTSLALVEQSDKRAKRKVEVEPPRAEDALPARLCLKCGMLTGPHDSLEECVDALREALAKFG
jgi:hypothetical protein